MFKKEYSVKSFGYIPDLAFRFPESDFGEHIAREIGTAAWPVKYSDLDYNEHIVEDTWQDIFSEVLESEIENVLNEFDDDEDLTPDVSVNLEFGKGKIETTKFIITYNSTIDEGEARRRTHKIFKEIDWDAVLTTVIENFDQYDYYEKFEFGSFSKLEENQQRFRDLYDNDNAINEVVMAAFDCYGWQWHNYCRTHNSCYPADRYPVSDDAYDFCCWAIDQRLDYDQVMREIKMPVFEGVANPYKSDAFIPGMDVAPASVSFDVSKDAAPAAQTAPSPITPIPQTTKTPTTTMETRPIPTPETIRAMVPAVVPDDLIAHTDDNRIKYGAYFTEAEKMVDRYRAANPDNEAHCLYTWDANGCNARLYITELDILFVINLKVYNGKVSRARKAYIYTEGADGKPVRRTFLQSHNAIDFMDAYLAATDGCDVSALLDQHCNKGASKTPVKAAVTKPATTAPAAPAAPASPTAPVSFDQVECHPAPYEPTPEEQSELNAAAQAEQYERDNADADAYADSDDAMIQAMGPDPEKPATAQTVQEQPAPTLSPYTCMVDNVNTHYLFIKGAGSCSIRVFDIATKKCVKSSNNASYDITMAKCLKSGMTEVTPIPEWLLDVIHPATPNRTAQTKPDTAELARRKAAAEKEEAARKEAERIAAEKEETARKEAERIAAEKAAAEKAAAADEAERQRKAEEANKESTVYGAITTMVDPSGTMHIRGLSSIQVELVRSYIAGMKAALAAIA